MATNPNPFTEGPTSPKEPIVAFCQQCGRPLTHAMRHQLGAATFCEPCAAARAAQPFGGSASPAGAPPSGAPAAPNTGEPNPRLAAFLGFIPGVGAMYNGQYAKAAVHLIIFVVLVSLADSLNDVFYWLVWGWVFYQAFEAYHTAAARRDGLPLPDPFGWNDLGERIGMNRTSPPVTPPVPPPAPRSAPTTPPPPGSPGPEPMTTASSAPPPAAPDASFGSTVATPMYSRVPVPPVAPPQPTTAPVPPYQATPPPFTGFSTAAHPSTQLPYEPTFTGPSAPLSPDPLAPAPRRFPLGALWLIGLGVLFLLGNIVPDWRLSGRWIIPVLLAAAALWVGTNRTVAWRDRAHLLESSGSLAELSSLLLFPALLFTFAVLFALQIAHAARLGHTWPALLIVWGALLLLGRGADSATALHTSETATSPADRDL